MPAPAFADRKKSVSALIALWLAIHGGDPPPSEVRVDETAALLAGALDLYLASIVDGSARDDQAVSERLRTFGIELIEHGESEESPVFEICWKVPVVNVKTGKPTGRYITVCTPLSFIR